MNRKGKKFKVFNFSLSLPAVQKSAYQIYVWSNKSLTELLIEILRSGGTVDWPFMIFTLNVM